MKKNTKCSFWVKQLRRPICALVAIAIVFFYSFSAFAATITFSDYEDFFLFTGIDPNTSYPVFTSQNVGIFATENGYQNFNNVNGGIFNYVPSGVNASQYQEWQRQMFAVTGRNFPQSMNIDGVDFDLSNCYWMITSPSTGTAQIQLFWGSSQIAFVDYYLVSEQPFYVTRNAQSYTAGYWAFNGVPNYVYVSTPSDNGFYCYDIRSLWYYCATNLSMYASSSDGNSGFTNFSLTSTDFTFGNQNYDFNFYKSDLGVIAGSDPVPAPAVSDVEANAYHNMNVTMRTSYVGPFLNTSCECRFNYGWNEYILTYPNLFEQVSDYEANIVYVSASGVETEATYHYSSRIPCQTILTNLNHMANDGSKYSEKLLFTNFVGWVDALGEHDLEEGLNVAQSAISGSGSAYGSWLTLFENINNSVNSLIGIEPSYLWTPNNNRGIKEFSITGEHYIASVKDNVVLKSGVYKDKADFVQNSYFVMQNDIPVNQYPYEETPPSNLPSGTIQNGTLYPPMSSYYPQASSTINNAFSSIEAKVEYLFNLDASDLNNIAGNSQNTIQYVINSVSDNSENGFWGVLEKGYSVIPDDIWNWIKVSVATLLGGAVIGWVYNGVRIKR